jgi:hypothetical protein
MEGRLQLRLQEGVLVECPRGVKTPDGPGATHTRPRRVRLCPRRAAQPQESQPKSLQGGGSIHPEPQDSGGPERGT